MKLTPWICPSLLAGDFGALRESALQAERAGADALHMDIMDANFVPNLSMGADIVKMAYEAVKIPLHVHLMMMHPTDYLRQFVEAGAHTLSIHIEAKGNIPRALDTIRDLGALPGLVINPETPATVLDGHLHLIEEVLCMSVHPGFGGQKFMPEILPKLSYLHQKRLAGKLNFRLAVDGGIDSQTVRPAAEAGAETIIAGSSLYKAENMKTAIAQLRQTVKAVHGLCSSDNSD